MCLAYNQEWCPGMHPANEAGILPRMSLEVMSEVPKAVKSMWNISPRENKHFETNVCCLSMSVDEEFRDMADRPLAPLIEELIDRKHYSIQDREKQLTIFTHILTRHYAEAEVDDYLPELLDLLTYNLRHEESEKITILSLKALSLLVVTTMDAGIYDEANPLLKRKLAGDFSVEVKTAAIRTLGACAFIGGTEEECENEMDFLMEIITSDGNSIGAYDKAAPVIAAIQEWGLLVTRLEEYVHGSEDAVEALADQLDSSDVDVQIAAGQTIAMLYEFTVAPQEDGEEVDEAWHQEGYETAKAHLKRYWKTDDNRWFIERYKPYHDTPRIVKKVKELANTSKARKITKQQHRSIHMHFDAIYMTILNPRYGPCYFHHTAVNKDRAFAYDTRTTIRFHRFHVYKTTWAKWARLQAFTRILAGGLYEHYYARNKALFEALPDLELARTPPEKPKNLTKAVLRAHGQYPEENGPDAPMSRLEKELNIVRAAQGGYEESP